MLSLKLIAEKNGKASRILSDYDQGKTNALTCLQWSKEGTLGEWRLAHVVWSNRRATVARNSGSDRKVSEHTRHRSLLCKGLHSHRPVRGSTAKGVFNGHVDISSGPQSNGRRWSGLMNPIFFYIIWMACGMCIAYLGKRWYQDAGKKASRQRHCAALSSGCFGSKRGTYLILGGYNVMTRAETTNRLIGTNRLWN